MSTSRSWKPGELAATCHAIAKANSDFLAEVVSVKPPESPQVQTFHQTLSKDRGIKIRYPQEFFSTLTIPPVRRNESSSR